MTDIIELAKQAIIEAYGQEYLDFFPLDDEAGEFLVFITKFAQLLQQGEAVAKPLRNQHGSLIYDKHGDVIYEKTPPNTQQKLDKAREALHRIIQLKSPTLNSLATEIAQQALKEVE